MIYIIFGASGSGKTTFMNLIKSNFDNVDIHEKATTRKIRRYDDDEIISIPSGIPRDKYDYIYNQYGYEYGIEKAQIERSLSMNRCHFVICNDIEIIERIKNDYRGKVTVIFLCFDAPREELIKIQKKREISDDEIDVRLNKMEYLNQVFIENTHVFDEVIKNKYDYPDKMLKQVDRIINGLQAKRGSKIHFDISNFTVIWYDSMSELERKLKVMFENILTNKSNY